MNKLKTMKKIYQNPQSEVVKTVAGQMQMGITSPNEKDLEEGENQAPRRFA